MANVVRRGLSGIGKGDFFTLTSEDEYYQDPPQDGKKCCGKHKRCKRVSDAQRITVIKGGKK